MGLKHVSPVREKDDTYWDKRINIAHRSINRKKYYGLGVEIERYQDAVEKAVDVEDAVKVLKARQTEGRTVTEGLVDDIVERVKVVDLSNASELFNEIQGTFSDSFKKGTRRLFTKDGDRVDVDQFVDEGEVSELMQDQAEYFDNLQSDLDEELTETVRRGMEEGKDPREIADDLEQTSSNVSRNRADTIARSELTKASSAGTKSSMDRAGIEEFMWLSARNPNVCESGSFQTNINGQTFTSCRELDGTVWNKDGNHPVPVEHSHPSCRCTLIANV